MDEEEDGKEAALQVELTETKQRVAVLELDRERAVAREGRLLLELASRELQLAAVISDAEVRMEVSHDKELATGVKARQQAEMAAQRVAGSEEIERSALNARERAVALLGAQQPWARWV